MTDEKKKHLHKKWEDMSVGLKVLCVFGGIIAGAGLLILFGFIMMWLWNWLMPKLFGLPEIGYWEAWGVLILSHLLFRGFHGGAGHASERGRKRKLRERIREIDEDGCGEGEAATE